MSEEIKLEIFKDYFIPEWSGKAKSNYYLEVIKDGIELEDIVFKEKSFFLVGRHPDICDIVLDHVTISRKHAIFQFSKEGDVYLFDLGSKQATFVNNKIIPKKTFFKLKPGNFIKFGSSPVNYYLRCPEIEEKDEYTEDMKEVFAILGNSDFHKNKKYSAAEYKEIYQSIMYKKGFATPYQGSNGNKNSSEVNWNILEDDDIYKAAHDSNLPIKISVLKELPNLESKITAKINDLETQMQRMHKLKEDMAKNIEEDRIEGQFDEEIGERKEALKRRIRECQQKIDDLEDHLKIEIFEERASKYDRKKIELEDTFYEDEFFDRTKKKVKIEDKTQKTNANNNLPVENFYTLKERYDSLMSEQKRLNEKYLSLSETTIEKEEMDEYERYLAENQKELIKEEKSSILQQLKEIMEKLEDTRKLLRMVKPDFNDTPQSEIKVQPTKKKEKTQKLHVNSISNTLGKLKELSKVHKVEKEIETFEDLKDYKFDPDSSSEEEDQIITSDDPEKFRNVTKRFGVTMKQGNRNENEKVEEGISWQPPQNQSGDGKTKLNEKFNY